MTSPQHVDDEPERDFDRRQNDRTADEPDIRAPHLIHLCILCLVIGVVVAAIGGLTFVAFTAHLAGGIFP